MSFDEDSLLEASYDETPDFSLEGQVLKAKAVDVYDGDTASFAFLTHRSKKEKGLLGFVCIIFFGGRKPAHEKKQLFFFV